MFKYGKKLSVPIFWVNSINIMLTKTILELLFVMFPVIINIKPLAMVYHKIVYSFIHYTNLLIKICPGTTNLTLPKAIYNYLLAEVWFLCIH